MSEIFTNRTEAGQRLAEKLLGLRHTSAQCVVLALPRGGVPVGAAVAKRLEAPLDVLVVRKLGAPGSPELAIGAIATGEVRVWNDDVLRQLRLEENAIEQVVQREMEELQRREMRYRGNREPLAVLNRTVVLVDDGIATGATMKAAVRALRVRKPARIVVAVPVGPPEAFQAFHDLADECILLQAPEHFHAVGQFYDDFSQTTDEEVRACLGG